MLTGGAAYQPPPPNPDIFIKAEPVDPLKLDLGAEELDMKAEVAPEAEVRASLSVSRSRVE